VGDINFINKLLIENHHNLFNFPSFVDMSSMHQENNLYLFKVVAFNKDNYIVVIHINLLLVVRKQQVPKFIM